MRAPKPNSKQPQRIYTEISELLDCTWDGIKKIVEEISQGIESGQYTEVATNVEDYAITFHGYRLETPKEVTKRLRAYERTKAKNASLARKKEALERAEYQRLKAKFESK